MQQRLIVPGASGAGVRKHRSHTGVGHVSLYADRGCVDRPPRGARQRYSHYNLTYTRRLRRYLTTYRDFRRNGIALATSNKRERQNRQAAAETLGFHLQVQASLCCNSFSGGKM